MLFVWILNSRRRVVFLGLGMVYYGHEIDNWLFRCYDIGNEIESARV